MKRCRLLAAVLFAVALAATAVAITIPKVTYTDGPTLQSFGSMEVFDDEGKPVKAAP